MTFILVVNEFNKKAKNIVPDIENFLRDKGHKSCTVPFKGKNEAFPDIDYDGAISLGGDGTVLYAARQCVIKDKPVFPINFGEFGFIAGIKSNQWKTALHDFLENKIIPEKRSLLCAEVFRNKKSVHTEHALNDIVVTSKKTMQTIRLNVEANEIPFGKFKADGMIIATSTGSTAYSLAAGGPIVDPALDTIIFNPVSAFSLSVRPLVLPGETILKITVLPSRNYDFMLSCDGQVHADIEEGDCIVIKQSPYKALLVGCSADVFYEALRSKLHWSGGLFA